MTLDDGRCDAIGELAASRRSRRSSRPSRPSSAGDESTVDHRHRDDADYALVRAYDVWQGSFLTDATVERGLRVAVLGATTADDLGLDARRLGIEITIGGLPFEVIGILQPKGGAGSRIPTTRSSSRSASSRSTSSRATPSGRSG